MPHLIITMEHNNTKNSGYGFALFLIGCLFFVFGFITWANSQLIPYLRVACELSKTESYFVGTAFFAAYFVMAIPSSAILKKTGFKKGMSLGLFIMAAGALLFIPAAQLRSYAMFLSGLFVIGTGLTLLQTASNPYVTILGPEDSAARRMSIMGVCNKLAGICAVYLLGSLFLSNIDTLEASIKQMPVNEKMQALQALADKVIQPYLIIAAAFLALGLALLFVHLPEVKEEESQAEHKEPKSIFDHKHLILGSIAIFFYVGAEVISYDAFSTFGETLGFGNKTAAGFASYTGYSMLLGYLLSIILIPKFIDQRKALIVSCVLSCVLLIAALLSKGTTAVVLFALIGFSESVMWPAIWPLALSGLGSKTKLGGAFLIMMIVGGAVMMPLMGLFSDLIQYAGLAETTTAHRLGFLVMIPCWLYILFFAVRGYKVK